MGAKTWMLVYAQSDPREVLRTVPTPARVESLELARRIFPDDALEPIADGCLAFTNPPEDEISIGQFPGVAVVAATEFGIDYPSKLDSRFIREAGEGTLYLHAMHSVVDWFAFAVWNGGRLMRSLSVSLESGIFEDIGDRLPFEEPFWAGEHPAAAPEDDVDFPVPFHPLEMGEAALVSLFGYELEGGFGEALFACESVPLLQLKRTRKKRGLWARLLGR